MEQETKRCPYCGEEILAVAKKCKHCGEWLDEYNQNSQQKGTTDDHIDSYNDDDNYGNGNDHNHKELLCRPRPCISRMHLVHPNVIQS